MDSADPGRVAPDFKTIAAFRRDNGKGIRGDGYPCPVGQRAIHRFTRDERRQYLDRHRSAT